MENRALGKGLSALIPDKVATDQAARVTYLKTAHLRDNRLQPRTTFNDAKLEELKTSIKEKGVLQPILVREKNDAYEVIAGERRLKAARALNLDEVPVIVKEVSDQEALVIALIENIQREELNPIEEAEGYRRLIEEFQYSQDSVAQSVGKDRSTISNLLRLLRLPPEIKKSVSQGDISVGHARALLSVETLAKQKKLFERTVKKGLSVRELEHMVKGKDAAASQKISKTKKPELAALEEVLQKMFGTKVNVLAQKKKGRIVIEYYSQEDLERIIKILKK